MTTHGAAWVQRWRGIRRKLGRRRPPDAFCPDVGQVSATNQNRTLPPTSFCSHSEPAPLLRLRLQQLGIDPGYVKYARTASYRDLERECTRCTSMRQCARDLARGDVKKGMQRYCPNAGSIDALTVDGQPGANQGQRAATLRS